RVQEGIVTLGMYGRIMARAPQAQGLIPQVSVDVGDTEGIASFLPGWSDIIVMTSQAPVHQARPRVVSESFGEESTAAELGGAEVHSDNGSTHLVAASDEVALGLASDVLSFLLVNDRAEAPRTEADIMAGSIADNVNDEDKKLL